MTIEGLARGDALHPVQEAFLAEGAMQCGYCTPGLILEVVGLLQGKASPTDAEILARLEGHTANVNCVAFVPDDRVLSGGSDATVRLWSLSA